MPVSYTHLSEEQFNNEIKKLISDGDTSFNFESNSKFIVSKFQEIDVYKRQDVVCIHDCIYETYKDDFQTVKEKLKRLNYLIKVRHIVKHSTRLITCLLYTSIIGLIASYYIAGYLWLALWKNVSIPVYFSQMGDSLVSVVVSYMLAFLFYSKNNDFLQR